MPFVIAIGVLLLVVGLAGLFMLSARLIGRDMNHRFEKIRQHLEDDAAAIVQELRDDGSGI